MNAADRPTKSLVDSQTSDVGSIPIARSINPDDSVDLTRLSSLNWTKNRLVLDGSWTVLDSIGRSIRRRVGFPYSPWLAPSV
jgi:hypothetical protein